MESSNGSRVMGAGVAVTIAGEERRLLFNLAGLELIEEEFNGLANFTAALNGGFRSQRLKAVRVGLNAGGIPYKEVQAFMGSLVGGADFVAAIGDLHAAVAAAFDQAIPSPPKAAASKDSGREKGSPGPASTVKPSSRSTSAPASSAR